MNAEALVDEIDRRIRVLPEKKTEPVRAVRREYSEQLRKSPSEAVKVLAMELVGQRRWVAYELLYHHPGALSCLTIDDVERLGAGMDGWESVDAFGCNVSGPVWQRGLIPDEAVRGWATLAGPVVATRRAGLDCAAQPPVQGLHRRRRAYARHLRAARLGWGRHGRQGAVVVPSRTRRLGPRGGMGFSGRPRGCTGRESTA